MSVEIKNAITQLIDTIGKKPQVATSVFRASSYSEADSFAVRSQIRGFTTPIDEPLELGGTDTGPNPVEVNGKVEVKRTKDLAGVPNVILTEIPTE